MDTPHFPHTGDLEFSPANFPVLYGKLAALDFPLPVAEILELRGVLNDAMDLRTENEAGLGRRRRLVALYHDQMVQMGVQQPKHRERLASLLGVLDELHTLHRRNTRETRRALEAEMDANHDARRCSVRIGLFMGILWTLVAALWWRDGSAGLLLKATWAAATYLSLDSFYSLALLNRQSRALTGMLRGQTLEEGDEVQWPLLVRNLALILGYARGQSAELAFTLDESEGARSA